MPGLSHDAVLIRQLQGRLGGKAIRCEAGTATFTAANNTGAITVTHNIGRVPTYVGVFPAFGSRAMVANYIAGSRNGSTFQFRLDTVDGVAVTESVGYFWIAVG